jgi:phosphoribosylaminoimidazole-succinocarboxamide synthase
MSKKMASLGYEPIHQGKVRDTYDLGDDVLLVVASDRLSIFDFVLPTLVPGKGEVLTALTHFWLTRVFPEVSNHLLDPKELDLPFTLSEIDQKRCSFVRDLRGELVDAELIFRKHIGGSVYKKYLKTGRAGGHSITPGLPKWSKLDFPIFTPSTKAKEGHDINYDAADFFYRYDDEGRRWIKILLELFQRAYEVAESCGILIMDTKFETTLNILADEILTPDSSRFVDKENWIEAMEEGVDPAFLDKEFVRKWGKEVETPFGITGINNLDPLNTEHLKFVHSLMVPSQLIEETLQIYYQIFYRLTGYTLPQYQNRFLLT